MSFLYPRVQPKQWALLLGLALQGALIAGTYGMIHDQITYTISPEYFTRFKFEQFAYADLGWPTRWHVAEIGFLATWWVGFAAGWLLARSIVLRVPAQRLAPLVYRAFVILIASAVLCGTAGYLYGLLTLDRGGLEKWILWREIHVQDLRSFALVGYIHNCGYLGAIIGLIGGWVFLWQKSRTENF